jgi:sec-independent protein translocase protein TatC
MVRMSFLEHLEELRKRILHSIYGLAAVYLCCLLFASKLYEVLAGPFVAAMEEMGKVEGVRLVALTPTETFYLLYVKLPLIVGVFLASPWLMYQAWAFISPGLYQRERRWAAPFIFSTATLFVLGGVFGYFVALRFALAFLLGIGTSLGVDQMISIDAYANIVMTIILGLGLVFQMPVVIFFLTLIRLVTPDFLLNNVRYAILIIFVVAAAITPTTDVVNMIVFAGPMILLFYVGIFASYLLVLSREGRRLPAKFWLGVLIVLLLAAAAAGYYLQLQGYQFLTEYPWIVAPR